eukprot:760482-Hanusia_phi.AAC.6
MGVSSVMDDKLSTSPNLTSPCVCSTPATVPWVRTLRSLRFDMRSAVSMVPEMSSRRKTASPMPWSTCRVVRDCSAAENLKERESWIIHVPAPSSSSSSNQEIAATLEVVFNAQTRHRSGVTCHVFQVARCQDGPAVVTHDDVLHAVDPGDKVVRGALEQEGGQVVVRLLERGGVDEEASGPARLSPHVQAHFPHMHLNLRVANFLHGRGNDSEPLVRHVHRLKPLVRARVGPLEDPLDDAAGGVARGDPEEGRGDGAAAEVQGEERAGRERNARVKTAVAHVAQVQRVVGRCRRLVGDSAAQGGHEGSLFHQPSPQVLLVVDASLARLVDHLLLHDRGAAVGRDRLHEV